MRDRNAEIYMKYRTKLQKSIHHQFVRLLCNSAAKLVCLCVGILSALASEPAAEKPNIALKWLPASLTSPVARPFDALLLCPNGTWHSSNVKGTVELRNKYPVEQEFVWSVVPLESEKKEAMSSFQGFSLPEAAVGKLDGIRIKLNAKCPGDLNVLLSTEATRLGGFYTARQLGSIKERMVQGEQILDILFSQSDLQEEQRKTISGVGLNITSAPQTLVIKEISLLFRDEAIATEVQSAFASHNEIARATMVRWLKQRGIKLDESKNVSELERSLWQGAHLLAMGEQINYWSNLAKKYLGNGLQSEPLEENRRRVVEKLISGEDMKNECESLQGRVDEFVSQAQAKISKTERRWKRGDDDRFYSPDGKPYRFFGPFFFRSIYLPDPAYAWYPWDMRYLSSLGFNGIRLPIIWAHLEPEQGKFNESYLKMLKDIIHEAECYGLGVSIDLHWPYPDWFNKGVPGLEPIASDISAQNSYHWTDALVKTWEHLADELKDVPNIVAFEVPTNESPIGNGPKGIRAYPALLASWNDWLRAEYNDDRAALAAAWGENKHSPYSLKKNENWNEHSIEPLGYQDDTSAAEAYKDNPRLWDHLRWVAWMQQNATGKIMQAIHKSIPDAVGMMQFTIGGFWDKSPVPLNYLAIQTLTGDLVNPGTHYGLGGISAKKASTLTLASFDSEQQMEGNEAAVRNHVKMGLGLSPFSFHARGDGGLLFSDDSWYLKPDVAYLPRMTEWIRSFWPEKKLVKGMNVAIVENTRLAATSGDPATTGDLVAMLEKRGCSVGVLEGLRVVQEPSLLNGFDAVVTSSSFMDVHLLDILQKQFQGLIFLLGGLNKDAYAREGSYSIRSELASRDILFKQKSASRKQADRLDSIDLTGTWEIFFDDLSKTEQPREIPDIKSWQKIQVPSMWGEKEMIGTGRYHVGDAWYRKQFFVPKEWSGSSLLLEIGAIDDIDWAFVNGKPVGATGKETPDYWIATRRYEIPSQLLRFGENNELYICVRNVSGDGGIWRAPVQLNGALANSLRLTSNGKEGPYNFSSEPSLVQADLLKQRDVKVLAEMILGKDREVVPAMVRDGRWIWFAGDLPWRVGSSDEMVASELIQQMNENPERN